VFWVISVYFNIRNTLPKSGTFLLGHLIYIYIYIYAFRNVYWVIKYDVALKHNTFISFLFRYKSIFLWYESPVHDIALLGSKVSN